MFLRHPPSDTILTQANKPHPEWYQEHSVAKLLAAKEGAIASGAEELREDLLRYVNSYIQVLKSACGIDAPDGTDFRVHYTSMLLAFDAHAASRLWVWLHSHEDFRDAWLPFSEEQSAASLKSECLQMPGPLSDAQAGFLFAVSLGLLQSLERDLSGPAPKGGVQANVRRRALEAIPRDARRLLGDIRKAEISVSAFLVSHLEALAITAGSGTSPGQPKKPLRLLGETFGRGMLIPFEFSTQTRRPFPRSIKSLIRLCGLEPPDAKDITGWMKDLVGV